MDSTERHQNEQMTSRAGRPFLTRVHRRVRQPEYTGENRCLPCTTLNAGIAVVLAGAMAIVSVPLALGVLVVCGATIAVRGYLVPGTPTLVQYLPNSVHRALGGPHPTHTVDLTDPERDVAEILEAARITQECPDEDDLCLTDDFRQSWYKAMARFETEPHQRQRLAETLAVSPDEIRFEEDDEWMVYVEDISADRWPSQEAFIVDLASEALLGERLENWTEIPAHDRARLISSLRAFVADCPTCGGTVQSDEQTVQFCCGSDTVAVETACEDCNAVVFEGTRR